MPKRVQYANVLVWMRSQSRTKAEIYIEIICFDLAIRIESSMKKSSMLNNMNINMTFDQWNFT